MCGCWLSLWDACKIHCTKCIDDRLMSNLNARFYYFLCCFFVCCCCSVYATLLLASIIPVCIGRERGVSVHWIVFAFVRVHCIAFHFILGIYVWYAICLSVLLKPPSSPQTSNRIFFLVHMRATVSESDTKVQSTHNSQTIYTVNKHTIFIDTRSLVISLSLSHYSQSTASSVLWACNIPTLLFIEKCFFAFLN